MVNRAALIRKYKAPAVRWVNEADPYNDDPGITIESVNEDRTVYLIREEEADSPGELKKWIKMNCEILFENELSGWYTDESLWPKKRNISLYYEWFEVECHTVIIDTLGLPIEDDET